MEMLTHRETLSTGKSFAIRDELAGSAAHLQLQIERMIEKLVKTVVRA